jgi:hypothetical protein
MTGAKREAKPTIQLFALTTDKLNFYYGELHDDHLLRGSSRGMYASNVKIIDMTTEWKAYLSGRVIEIEQSGSKWIKVTMKPEGLKYMLQHDSGYVMPLLRVTGFTDVCRYFPQMAPTAPAAIPKQTVRVPGIVVPPPASASASASRAATRRVFVKPSREDDADAICNGDEDNMYDIDKTKKHNDEGEKERDALSDAVELMIRSRPKSKSKVSFTK